MVDYGLVGGYGYVFLLLVVGWEGLFLIGGNVACSFGLIGV